MEKNLLLLINFRKKLIFFIIIFSFCFYNISEATFKYKIGQKIEGDFNISDVQKAGAIFDITKLDWLNTQHIGNLSLEDFKKELKPFLEDLSIDIDNHQNVNLLLSSMRTVESTFKKIADDLNMSLTKRVHQLSATCKDNNCAHSKN